VTTAWSGRLADGGTWTSGPLTAADCDMACAAVTSSPAEACTPAGPGMLSCTPVCLGGRAPPGLLSLSDVDATPGSWIARMAELEAAAVTAFRVLADELEAHGLPAAPARRAAEDEIRHARLLTGLSLRMGALPRRPQIDLPPEPRSLEELAVENAAEGCGREAFGALVNAWQAEHAEDADVRAVMRSIVPDEQAHARASQELHELLAPRLTLAARRRAKEAREQALLALSADPLPELQRRRLGLLDAARAREAALRLLA